MLEEFVKKIGYYSVYKISNGSVIKYKVDNGKTLLIKRLNKIIANPYRDIKEFNDIKSAEAYIQKKLSKGIKKKAKKLKALPKSLYLVILKEEKTNLLFVKVGFTTKKFIIRRFSKTYGYEGYQLETILRRVDSEHAEKIEKEIKDALNKKRTIKKYRPLLESFSGYSECYDYKCLEEIIKIFDKITANII